MVLDMGDVLGISYCYCLREGVMEVKSRGLDATIMMIAFIPYIQVHLRLQTHLIVGLQVAFKSCMHVCTHA
jgi:hypothetical protein